MKQRTLKESFKVNGKGLHTGLMIEATFLPAPENHGYKFQRLDMGNPSSMHLPSMSQPQLAAP